MSIPGLGELPSQLEPASSTRIIQLRPLWEWRFEVAFGAPAITVKLLLGTAERDGTELALGHGYSLAGGVKSKLLTWLGCDLEVTGSCADEFVAEYAQPADTPSSSYLNLHFKLAALRAAAARSATLAAVAGVTSHASTIPGPRLLVAGPPGVGKTALVRLLAAYATRMSSQPMVVNLSPREGMLSLPGTLSAAVFATVMDLQSTTGWGDTPTSGPSSVPVKLPLVYYYGRPSVEDDPERYHSIVRRLSSAVAVRMAQDPVVGSSGLIVDTPGFAPHSKIGIDTLILLAEELSIDTIVVLGAERMYTELTKHLSTQKTRIGEPYHIVHLNKSEGVVDRDQVFMRTLQETVIKEYFFGGPGRALSPLTHTVDFDSLLIYRFAEVFGGTSESLERTEITLDLSHWTLAVMCATSRDTPDSVRIAPVLGFVNVVNVDMDRRKLRILAPVGGRLGDRPLIWGRWPEPCMNLLG